MQQNKDSINKLCEICGKEDICNTALSELRIAYGYGSRYEGETLSLTICGECADRILEFIQNGGMTFNDNK